MTLALGNNDKMEVSYKNSQYPIKKHGRWADHFFAIVCDKIFAGGSDLTQNNTFFGTAACFQKLPRNSVNYGFQDKNRARLGDEFSNGKL